MTLLNTMGLISTIALFIPIILLLALKLAWYKSFPALFLFYFFLLSYNVVSLNYIPVSQDFVFYHKLINHLLEVPLILLFYTYFSRTTAFRKKLLIGTFVFIAFEMATLAFYGFTKRATTVFLSPGLLAVLILSAFFFFYQVRIAVIYHKAVGKAIIIASLVFAFAGFSFVYVVNHLIDTNYAKDLHLIYYLTTIITSIPMSIGLYFERRRVQHLAELQTTREELKKIYGEEKTENPSNFGTIALNYDKEQWN